MPEFGKVVGQFATLVVDGSDADTLPDPQYLQGKVTFRLNAARVIDPTAMNNPLIYGSSDIVGVLDSSGYLCTPTPANRNVAGYRGLWLLATNDPDLNPTDMQYEVSYSLTDQQGNPVTMPTHQIALPMNSTLDLGYVIPPAAAPPIGTAAAEAAAALAVAAADAASGLHGVVAGTNITIDATDPHNPIISSTATGGTSTAAQITDATTIGRNVIKAADAAAIRSIIGAGTSSLVIGTASGTVPDAALTNNALAARALLTDLSTGLAGKASTAAQAATDAIATAARDNLAAFIATKAAANGLASLDSGGKVPSGQLPSYVDDVVEAANYASLPATGETGKIYVTLNDNKEYRWGGSAYVVLVSSPGSSDAVPEGSSNLYYTDARAIAANASLLAAKVATSRQINGHALTSDVTVTKTDVGLSNVDNTSDVNKPVSTATSTAIAAAISALTKSSVGLANVDNTSDANKPVSTLQAAADAKKDDSVIYNFTTNTWPDRPDNNTNHRTVWYGPSQPPAAASVANKALPRDRFLLVTA